VLEQLSTDVNSVFTVVDSSVDKSKTTIASASNAVKKIKG
jgi:hypothetical protein